MNDNERLRTAEKMLVLLSNYIKVNIYKSEITIDLLKPLYKGQVINKDTRADKECIEHFISISYPIEGDAKEIQELLETWRTYEKE